MKQRTVAFLLSVVMLLSSGCGNVSSMNSENLTSTEKVSVEDITQQEETSSKTAQESATQKKETTSEAVQENSVRQEETSSKTAQKNSVKQEETSLKTAQKNSSKQKQENSGVVTEGTKKYRGFILDNVLHSEKDGDIHYNLYIPDSYDGRKPYAVFFTLPGYEGLYFQGVGENLYREDFGFTARAYNRKMIIVAPQLSDWGEVSANQTIALVEYFLSHYNIDPDKVYGEGYSGGGETMSQVMGKRPDLFTAYLHCSSQWDGAYAPVVESRTPVYLVVGEEDEYYGSEPSREAYDNLYELYRQEGLSDKEIENLLILDVKDASYFESRGMTNQHGGGGLFARDENIMTWFFDK